MRDVCRIDDDAELLDVLRWTAVTILRAGLQVAVMSEADALVSHGSPPPRLLILDDSGHRPERDASLRRLQAHPAFIGVPFVILAYDADIDSFSDAITKGAAAYLVKPVAADELMAVAQRLSGWTGTSDRTEKRRRLRRPLVLKVEVDLRARKLRVPGEMVDVSGSGCRIELAEAVAPAELVRVILQGHEGSTHVALGGEVRWHRVAPSGAHVAGVRFTGTTAMLAGKLLGFVSSGST